MKKVFALMVLVCTLLTVSSVGFAEESRVNPVEQMNAVENIQRAPTTVWKYKTENGKLYKRLWDVTNLVWIGNWILVG